MKSTLIFFLLIGLNTLSSAQNDARILWKFKAHDSYIQGRPAIGTDGTIYALGINGHLYALTPQGKLKWTYTVLQGSVQSVSVGNNGIIYFAGLNSVYAIKPDGTLKWKVTNTQGGLIDVGPTVGPDGNIYAVADNPTDSGLSAVSITPSGQIRWNKRGYIHANGTAGQTKEVVFSAGQLYFCMNKINGKSGLQALKMSSGERAWTQPGTRQPAVAPDGRIYTISALLTNSYAELSAYSTAGSLIKKYFGDGTKDLSSPDVDSNGVFYVGRNYQHLIAENPDGTKKFSVSANPYIGSPVVSPLNNLVVVGGSQSFNPGYVIGISKAGQLNWSVSLSLGNGNYATPLSRPTFSKDGSVAYIGTALNYTTDSCYLYALSTTSSNLNAVNTIVENYSVRNNSERAVSFYPNPARDEIHIQAEGTKTITITDNTGRVFISKKINGFENVNISSLPAGTYFITDGSKETAQKLIIQK